GQYHPMRRPIVLTILVALLALAGGLMIGAMRDESATVDETGFFSGGYTDWKGYRYRMVPEHPPLAQMLVAIPLLFQDLRMSREASALLEGRLSYPWTRPWSSPPGLQSIGEFATPGCQGQV